MNHDDFRPRITAVADSDSYLKLACTTLAALGPGWDRRVVLLRTPLLPTTDQIAAASAGTPFADEPIEVSALSALDFGTLDADVVFAAATGPVVSELYTKLLRSTGNRPRRAALVSALPGVAFPATLKGWRHRRAGDGFIVHSHAEAREFGQLAEAEAGHRPAVLVSKLPFLAAAGFPQPQPPGAPITHVVFAAQAKVPVERAEREAILLALEATARLNPTVRVVVKLRARAGEPQTHAEAHPFDELWHGLVASGQAGAGHVEFACGSMDAVLVPGAALLTVSSTAALEAIDRGLPVLVLTDFGLNERMINTVFGGSGLLGTLEHVQGLQFFAPNRTWMRENYFHRRGPGFASALLNYAVRARCGQLDTNASQLELVRPPALRHRVRSRLPRPVLKVLRRLRGRLVRRRGNALVKRQNVTCDTGIPARE